MKKLIIKLLIALSINCLCFGVSPAKTIENNASIQDAPFIEVYVDKKGNIFLDKKKISLVKLENFLKETDIRKAKLATVFPTPMNVFATVEQVNNLFEKFNIEAKWFKDTKFSIPAWE